VGPRLLKAVSALPPDARRGGDGKVREASDVAAELLAALESRPSEALDCAFDAAVLRERLSSLLGVGTANAVYVPLPPGPAAASGADREEGHAQPAASRGGGGPGWAARGRAGTQRSRGRRRGGRAGEGAPGVRGTGARSGGGE